MDIDLFLVLTIKLLHVTFYRYRYIIHIFSSGGCKTVFDKILLLLRER